MRFQFQASGFLVKSMLLSNHQVEGGGSKIRWGIRSSQLVVVAPPPVA